MNFNFSYADNKFYLPADVEIKAKNSNQILSGHMSDKIGLESKMKIRLEGFELEILEIDENSLWWVIFFFRNFIGRWIFWD